MGHTAQTSAAAAASARENLRAFALEERGEAVCADYRSAPFESESLDFIVSNPPYFPAGRGAVSPNAERAAQRTESATVSELCSASARYLKPGGQFFLVHRRKRESDILAALHNAHLTPVRRRDVFSAPGKRAPIFLMEAVKGAPVSAMRGRPRNRRIPENLPLGGIIFMAGTLYLVGTPIGNLNDLSPRAIETLKSVDFIAAEDTRVTLKLLNHFGIRRPLISYYEHNKVESAAVILPRLLGGESCALVSDAGMPAISDPGEELVRLCGEHGITVSAAPGPSAVITALAMSGLPTQRFTFEGFLSTSNKSRKEHLETLRHEHRTIVLYEAPHKLAETLGDLYDVLGDRDIALGRELTKLHEEIVRTTIGAALEKYRAERPRGEFVLVIRGAPVEKGPRLPLEDALALVEEYRAGGMKLKDAAKRAAAETGQSRNDLYHAALVREKETGAEE